MRVRLRDEHFVDIVHRASAAVLGVLLALFAVGGFATDPAFFSTRGPVVLGMFTNGALSALSAMAAGGAAEPIQFQPRGRRPLAVRWTRNPP